MLDKDQILLERAYLTLSKAITPKPRSSKIEEINPSETEEREEIVSSGPMTEPAPGVDVEMVDGESEVSPDDTAIAPEDASELEPSMPDVSSSELGMVDDHVSEEEQEEDEMAIDNLNSIRESICKIASFCSMGGHLEAWQQQKLAIAMDNLAGVARSLRN